MTNLPNRQKLLRNFSLCSNWEEKYLYIIELGNQLPPLPKIMRTQNNLIADCQSQVWIAMSTNASGVVQFYGDSDTAIVKGLIAIVFVFYKELMLSEIIIQDIKPFFDKLSLVQHLTLSRSHGLEAIVRTIRAQAIALC